MVSTTSSPSHTLKAKRNSFVKDDNRGDELRVLQVFSSLAMGGAETWLMALLRYFQKNSLPRPIRTDILLTGSSGWMFESEAAQLGARLFHHQFTRRKSVSFANRFRQILREGRYHAIHDHQDYSAGLRFVMGLGLLPPVRIAHVHNTSFSLESYNSSRLRRMTFRAAKKFLSRTATHITSTSNEMLKDFGFESDIFKNISRRVVHCGFDVSQFKGDNSYLHQEVSREFGWNDDARILLFVGRLDEPVGSGLHRKNPSFALEVARACIEKDRRVRLIMAGSGEQMKQELERRVKNWRLENHIRFTGIYPDITRLMLGADLFLFPSIAEGLGMVVVEAQAAGLPVLTSTGVPQESRVITDLVKFLALKEGVSAWAQAAMNLLEVSKPNAIICNDLVQESQFSIENSARALFDIYSK